MDYVDLRPGTAISVAPVSGEAGVAFESVVRSVSEGEIRISMPRRDEEWLTVEAGEPLMLFTSVGEQVYRFPTRVRQVEAAPEDGMVIEPPVEAEKNERRAYYRLLTRIVPRYVGVVTRGEGDSPLVPRYAAMVSRDGTEVPLDSCVILDISGGGLQIQALTPPRVGDQLHLVFALEGDPLEMDIYADVLSVRPSARGGRYHRLHSRFVSAPRVEVERLVRYVTRQQIERRRRGLL